MRSPRVPFLAAGCCLLAAASLAAQRPSDGYHSSAALASALKSAAGRAVTVSTIATSPGGFPVQAVRLGAGDDVDSRPAVLLIANAWGPEVVGSEIALGVVQKLGAGYGKDSAVTSLLDRATIYVIPRANPDAAEAFFQNPLVERVRNASKWDDDRDAAVDEDGPEDLNGDGIIAMMRIKDPAGEWIADSAEPALMRKAETAKGEVGAYRVYLEGRDNDGDEQWQEDPPGGVDIGRSFPYEFSQFGEATGAGMMAEVETRAIAQFIVDHPGIAVIYTLGPQDNLLKAWEGKALPTEGTRPGTSAGGPLKAILKEDEPWFTEVAKRYRDVTHLEKGPASAVLEGDPVSWGYFDMGRWSFGARPWWVPDVNADSTPGDSTHADSAHADPAHGDSTHAAGRGGPRATGTRGAKSGADSAAADRNAIKWLRANEPGAVLDWTTFRHPDFPDQDVEIGGIRPFALVNPPSAMLDSLSTEQTAFVTALSGMLPSISLRKLKTESLGPGLFRITVEVANDGYLPTSSKVGDMVRMPRPVRVVLDAGKGHDLVSGRRYQLLDPISGSGTGVELTWVVRGSSGDRMSVTAESPAAGHASLTFTLR
ncbi:MAG TPA: M14 family metallopeptidase [Gemmatimonadales bacterium]|nr:M14 family metallopeptidase [Gemmatimonadales bacterium]